MRALLQRVSEASVAVAGEVVSAIEGGLVVLLGVAAGDGESEADSLARKVAALRVFADADGKMNLSLTQAGGSALLEFVGRPRVLAGCSEIEVPVGSLAEVLSHAPGELDLCNGERVAPAFLVSLGGRDFVRDTRVPIGPGEHVIVLDAAAGG